MIVTFYEIKQKLIPIVDSTQKRGVKVNLEKLPHCIAPHLADIFVPEAGDIPYYKPEECKKCIFKDKCIGIEKNYTRDDLKFQLNPIFNTFVLKKKNK